MTTILNRIILLNIELEGALRVAANRPSEEALDNAKRKFAEISALFAMLNPTEYFASIQNAQTEIKIAEAESAEESPLEEPKFEHQQEMLDVIKATQFEEPLATHDVEEEVEECVEEEAEQQTADEFTPEVEEMTEPEDAKEEVKPIEGKTFEPRREPVDIRKMFTLNDKFLFKRELFGNNDEEFNSTLDLISSMHSFDEVEEYAYEDLSWDKNDARVRDFMKVVRGYFG